jgi:hypothetical protein
MKKGSGRALTGTAIIFAWLAGLGMLVRREYFRPHIDRLAEAALRVQPGAVFYAVMQGDQQVGFASSTIDTSTSVIEQREYLVADVAIGGRIRRTTARTNVTLTRTLRVRAFDVSVEGDSSPRRIRGEVLGDSLVHVVTGDGSASDTQRVVINGPILLPTLAPLAVVLEDEPSVGKSYVLPLLDPGAAALRDVRIDVRAESLFVVNDSSVFDSTAGRWRGVTPIQTRAWQIASQSGGGVNGWVDEQGRLVASNQLGFRLRRLPYEVAFENWRIDNERTVVTASPVPSNRKVLDISPIAAGKRLRSNFAEMRVRLSGVQGRGFDLAGTRQQFSGDTLTVVREDVTQLAARYMAIESSQMRLRGLNNQLRAEPFLEVDHPEIQALAQRLSGGSREPRGIVQRINAWVHDSVANDISTGIPSALRVLHSRRGDSNEHAQLFVALARAAGVPARAASGLVYIDGRFYYHAWAEVLLRGWVAVDPTFGQMPADAAHLRFVIGGLGQQGDLLRVLGALNIDVLETR